MTMYVHKKIDLHNFGCDRIFVISDPDNIKRRQSFIDDWKYFDGFNYEFIDSDTFRFIEDDGDVTLLYRY